MIVLEKELDCRKTQFQIYCVFVKSRKSPEIIEFTKDFFKQITKNGSKVSKSAPGQRMDKLEKD